jgi:hypothetical protein
MASEQAFWFMITRHTTRGVFFSHFDSCIARSPDAYLSEVCFFITAHSNDCVIPDTVALPFSVPLDESLDNVQ